MNHMEAIIDTGLTNTVRPVAVRAPDVIGTDGVPLYTMISSSGELIDDEEGMWDRLLPVLTERII